MRIYSIIEACQHRSRFWNLGLICFSNMQRTSVRESSKFLFPESKFRSYRYLEFVEKVYGSVARRVTIMGGAGGRIIIFRVSAPGGKLYDLSLSRV